MLEELDHIDAAGIPIRRPNGMNRYGCILDDVGFDSVLTAFSQKYLTPLMQLHFPNFVGANDTVESYAFVVRYKPGEDVSLEEHGDASVATLNMCLGDEDDNNGNEEEEEAKEDEKEGDEEKKEEGEGDKEGKGGRKAGFEGGELAFAPDYTTFPPPPSDPSARHRLRFRPGLAVLHKGQQRHAALPLRRGRRVNMVVWLMGKWGVVRVAPYKEGEQLSMQQRWGLEQQLGGGQGRGGWIDTTGAYDGDGK